MRLVDADALIETIKNERFSGWGNCCVEIDNAPTVDAVRVVRCKECKHRPKYDGPNRLVFPDGICPCQCDDEYYNWMPSDNWFCADGEG
jgi:hypothetical protein